MDFVPASRRWRSSTVSSRSRKVNCNNETMLHVTVPDRVGEGQSGTNHFFEKCRKHAKMRSRTDHRRHVANGNGWTNGGIPRSCTPPARERCRSFSNVSRKSHGTRPFSRETEKGSWCSPTSHEMTCEQRMSIACYFEYSFRNSPFGSKRALRLQFKQSRCTKVDVYSWLYAWSAVY